MKPLIFDIIEGHYESGQALIVDRSKTEEIDIQEGDLEVVKIIKELLAERVRPFVQDDGGDVKFVGFDEGTGVLTVKMMGSCSGCPSSEATLKQGILKMMKYYVGEINDVVKDTE